MYPVRTGTVKPPKSSWSKIEPLINQMLVETKDRTAAHPAITRKRVKTKGVLRPW